MPGAVPRRPVVLVLVDGLGHREERAGNAVHLAHTPVLSKIAREHRRALIAGGRDSGLSLDQAGSSEACLAALGSGRPPIMNVARIDAAIGDGSLARNEVIRALLARAKDLGGRLHLVGLVSDGRVHSAWAHLLTLIDLAQGAKVRVVVHAVLDGCDAPPRSAPRFVALLEERLAGGTGRIGTVSGRHWAMDRGGRWDRIHKSYRAIVADEVRRADSALRGIEQSYELGRTDELVEPFVVFDYPGVSPVDVALHFNFRADRGHQLARALAARDFDAFARKGGRAPFAGRLACLTALDSTLDLPTAFAPAPHSNGLGELVAQAGYRQFRCAEVEGLAKVTTFFDSGRAERLEGEDRQVVPSLRDGPAHEQSPDRTTSAVADAAVDAIGSGKYEFVLVHFANADALAHSGNLAATLRAVEGIDRALGALVEATRSAHGALVVTSAHGNCEQMIDSATGSPHTRHTESPLPFYYVNDADPEARLREGGGLCDVAPTVVELLGLEQPAEMAGRSLLIR
jgi:2,3-bisphosphoglycerate-independent phosphoglycerate mutase